VNRRSRTWGLEISIEPVAGGIVLAPKGRIGSVTAPAFADALNAALAGSGRVIIDLTDVDYVSGPAVRTLQQSAATDRGRTIVCGLQEAVGITLELGDALDGVLVMKDRAAALESLISD
jgi:anti-anti-sigma factor